MTPADPRTATGARVLAALVLLALLAAACGRVENYPLADVALEGTVGLEGEDGEAAPADGPDGSPLVRAPPDEPTAPPQHTGGPIAGRADGQPRPGAAAPGDPARAGTAPVDPPHRPRTGKGVSETEIHIGFQVSEDLQTGFAAVGAEGDAADERRVITALVEHVNASGGIAGRRLVPVFHGTNAVSGTWAAQAQGACATFTEDHEVFAVVSSAVGGSDAMLACTASQQTPLIEQNLWLFDEPYWQRHAGWLYQPGKMRADRWAGAYVDGLARAGFFRGGTLGIARFDAPVFTRVTEGVVEPALARHGVPVEAEEVLSTPQSVSDFGRMNAEINNAILRFRAAGVDRVMFIENAGILPFFWMPTAESQSYRPRYGLSSNSIPATMARQAPARQLEGSLGVGWTPPNDADVASDYPPNPASDECLGILHAQGIPQHWAGFYTHSACEAIFFLEAVVPRVPEFTPAGLPAAVDSLGTEYRGPFPIATRLGPRRHDGAAAAQLFAYHTECECFRYQGRAWDVP